MALAPPPPDEGRRRGPNWGSIFAYGLIAALALLALAPLLSAWN